MLVKSLPFIGNRLLFPFLSRGDGGDDDFDSVYWDAPSDGKSKEKWEPEPFYKYVDELTDRNYDGEGGSERGEEVLLTAATVDSVASDASTPVAEKI